MINGGVAPVVIAVGVIALPFVLGTMLERRRWVRKEEGITEHDWSYAIILCIK